jgi:hypothetical protein
MLGLWGWVAIRLATSGSYCANIHLTETPRLLHLDNANQTQASIIVPPPDRQNATRTQPTRPVFRDVFCLWSKLRRLRCPAAAA